MPGQAKISKTAVGTYPFSKPFDRFGDLLFGYGAKEKFYQYFGFKSAAINEDFSIITLYDGTNSSMQQELVQWLAQNQLATRLRSVSA
ncbi:unnamed protein product [Blepharisma stoltei]|uniref:Uncharacterized protein n=1 Tax=Blepharisma stoltei TaxID=1481888 RepID=A0AAU9KAV3_9CILI|nr:unnamed protein product [Blepharisma stoltei]